MSNAPQPAEAEGSGPRILRRADLAIAAILVVIAIATFAASSGFPVAKLGNDVGAARFPRIYAVVLVVLAGLLALQAWRRPVPAGATAPTAERRQALPRVMAGMGICLACFVAMQFVGFVPAALTQFVGLMLLMGRRHWVQTTLIAVALTAAVYFLFVNGLNVPLPLGIMFE